MKRVRQKGDWGTWLLRHQEAGTVASRPARWKEEASETGN